MASGAGTASMTDQHQLAPHPVTNAGDSTNGGLEKIPDDQVTKEQRMARNLKKFEAIVSKLQQHGDSPTPDYSKMEVAEMDVVNAYQPRFVDTGRYKMWQENGSFKPRQKNGNISMVDEYIVHLPPPSATGLLHVGARLTRVLQLSSSLITIVRAKTTIWLPDHDQEEIHQKMRETVDTVLECLGPDFHPTATPEEPCTLVEQWILHKLNDTARQVSDAGILRDFTMLTSVHHYWLHHLRDKFIEHVKLALGPEADLSPTQRQSMLQTLYTALEGALVLGYRAMPFLMERLWQKLPRRQNDNSPSIMFLPYPKFKECWHRPQAVEDHEWLLEMARTLREGMRDYRVRQARVTLHVSTDRHVRLIQQHEPMIKYLVGRPVVNIMARKKSRRGRIPRRQVHHQVNANESIFFELGADFDLSGLIRQQEQTLQAALETIDRANAVMSERHLDPAVVLARQKEEEARLADVEDELSRLLVVIDELKRLKSEE